MSAIANHWDKNLEEFRRSSSKFLSERNISGDSFVLDILKVLCCENLPEYLKLQLLLLIQEKASSLLVESASVECVVGSLKEMFAHPYGNMQQHHVSEIPSSFLQASVERGNVSQVYLSQVLVTGTVVLITSELLEINQEVFTDFIGVLTDVIGMVNNANNLLLRKAACECLWELELSYPGLLQAKLDHLYAFCATEHSPIFQSYMVLFVSVLHHAMEHLLSESADSLDDSCLNRLLTSRTEPLKPLYLPGQASKHLYPVTIHSRAFSSTFSSLPRDVDTRELKRAISFVMDNIGFTTTAGLYHVMLQLMQCVKLAGLSPNTFKSQFITWVSTTDLSVFHMLLLFKLKFSRDMFLEHDELLLLQRILLVSSQPTLPQGQRLLCFEWLMYFPTDQEASALLQPCVPPILQYAQYNFFYPSVFDHLDIMANKLRVLCLCLDHERMNMEDAPGLPLIECLLPLLKRIQHGDHRRKVVVTLFRIIFWYYKNHWDTELGKDIYRLVLSMVTEHPQFTPHAEDLLNSFAVVTPNSAFPTQLLRSLCQHVVSQPMETILPNLAHHLKILSLAMRHKDIASSPTIRFLVQVLNKSDAARNGNWSTGNNLLAVCHSILLHRHSSTTFSELGDLLLHICVTYKDIDIRDRARFYYCLLTNVSSKKCSKILTSETTRYGLPNVTADDITSSSFPVPPPMKHISTPFLKLTRVSQPRLEGSLSDLRLSASSEPEEDTAALRVRGLFDQYMKQLEGLTNNKEVPITYYVHFTDGLSSSFPLTIYALMLKFHCERRYKKLEDVLISYLLADKSSAPVEGCHQITVTFCPLDPVPATFRVRAIFNDEDGQVCEMMLDNLQIHFSDLFIPLHIPSLPKPTPLALVKANLFTALWTHITQNQRGTANPTATGAESVMRLSVEWTVMGRSLEDHLLRFVMMASDAEVQLGIFLPPRQHLLLKFRPLDEFTVVSIATDDWRLLRLVESYLLHLERVSE